jgi:DNA-binding NarL/FixJ family response regulator
VQGILAVAPETSVIVLSDHRDVEDLLAAVRAGAVGYLPGSLDGEQLRRVVQGVAAQEAAVPRAMVRELILELRSATAIGGLTEREAQVLGMLRRGHSTAQIAVRLEISPITVRRYISDLMRKLGADSREDLMRLGRGDPALAGGPATDIAGQADADGHVDSAELDTTADCAV